MTSLLLVALLATSTSFADAFQSPALGSSTRQSLARTTTLSATTASPKEELLSLLGRTPSSSGGPVDPVLCDPITKEPIRISVKGPILGEGRSSPLDVRSPSNRFTGSTNTYINLLEPVKKNGNTYDSTDSNNNDLTLAQTLSRQLTPFIPPPLRSALAMAGVDDTYIPMRDLFTSPSVSFAYERGWRQGFSQAGFPGADREFEMAKEYFAPSTIGGSTIVDMSCATGLFTRRFAAEDTYDRVLGCDYSDSMLTEARRRIAAEPSVFTNLRTTQLELIRLDVGQLPFQSDSINALHAGAAMHCWPDLDAGLSEIYRVLQPNGGRYFATTFLSSYFSTLQSMDGASSGGAGDVSKMAFQYFSSVEEMKGLLMRNGFESDKISIEVLGNACVVIRCEK